MSDNLQGFEQYCDQDMDWLLKDYLSKAYGNLTEINRLLSIKCTTAKNQIIKLIQVYGKLCFKAGMRCQKNRENKMVTESNEARYKAEKKMRQGVYITREMIDLCINAGIKSDDLAKTLGVSADKMRTFVRMCKNE